jgi:L-threonylcarbamoyladenylate synthase
LPEANSEQLPDGEETRSRAARLIREGGVIAFRTDTFYGLGADPFNVEALLRIKRLKGRDADKPILVVISDYAIAERFIRNPSPLFFSVIEVHWPGPLTIVVNARPEVPGDLTSGTGTVGLRLPDDEGVRGLIRACDGALTATSANLAGQQPARTAQEVLNAFPQGLDYVVDGGESLIEQPSTVLDLSGRHPRLIREGVIARRTLQQTLSKLGEEL